MELKIKESVLKDALGRWGAKAQQAMAVEECSEFVDALMKFRRGRVGIEAVAEEVADVLIVMLQMRELIGAKEVDSFIEEKVARLEKILGGLNGTN